MGLAANVYCSCDNRGEERSDSRQRRTYFSTKILPMPLRDCRILSFPKIGDDKGNLTFVENDRHIPFAVQRVYYTYDVPDGAIRGGHGHKSLEQVIIAISGSFDVVIDDGSETKRFHLNRSHYGLYVSPMMWGEIDNFSSGAVCLVLASAMYDESDYYREYAAFKAAIEAQR